MLSQQLASRYGVSSKAIRDIWKGRSWLEATYDLWDVNDRPALRILGRPKGKKDSKPRIRANKNPAQSKTQSELMCLHNTAQTPMIPETFLAMKSNFDLIENYGKIDLSIFASIQCHSQQSLACLSNPNTTAEVTVQSEQSLEPWFAGSSTGLSSLNYSMPLSCCQSLHPYNHPSHSTLLGQRHPILDAFDLRGASGKGALSLPSIHTLVGEHAGCSVFSRTRPAT